MAGTKKKIPRSIPLLRIGKLFSKYRNEEKLYYFQLAEKVNLSIPTLNQAELGRKITLETIHTLIDYYQIHPIDFWNEVYKEASK